MDPDPEPVYFSKVYWIFFTHIYRWLNFWSKSQNVSPDLSCYWTHYMHIHYVYANFALGISIAYNEGSLYIHAVCVPLTVLNNWILLSKITINFKKWFDTFSLFSFSIILLLLQAFVRKPLLITKTSTKLLRYNWFSIIAK